LAIVKSDLFEAYLLRLPSGVAMFLLHGPEDDLASERARQLVLKLVDDVADPFRVVRLSADTLAKDPGRLADEASAISMFGGRRVVWIEAGGRDLTELIGAVAESLPAETSLVVEADNLRKGSPLRTLFETRPNAASIECYPSGPADLAQFVDSAAREASVRLEGEARDHLVALLAADPGAARGEIAKLMLFAASAGVLSAADVDALASGGGASPVDSLVDFALSGELSALERAAMHTLSDSAEAALVATRLAARVALLIEIRQGRGEPERLQRLPYAVRRAVLMQANAWAPETLARRLPALLNLLIAARRSPTLAGGSVFRALTALAIGAQRARGDR
jgi:DNA polymerase-3 subunit delta